MMKLSQPVQVPEQYRSIVIAFLREYFDDEVWRLRNHFGIELDTSEMPNNDDDYLRLMIAESCEQIALAALGQTDDLDQGEVYEHVQGVVEKLFSVPGQAAYTIPQEFWETEFGSMVMLAYIWGSGEELITISEASELSGKSVTSISDLARRGRIKSYVDMSEPNPRRRTRLVKSEIVKFKKKRVAR